MPRKIVLAGGSGLLGGALTEELLRQGDDVVVLSRQGEASASEPGVRAGRKIWTPNGSTGSWVAALDGAAAVVNLAGESIAAGRWSPARRKSIVDSRVLSTRSLVAGMAAVRRPPPVLLSASAQGYYGDRADEELTEASPPGRGFLAGVCSQWEAEARRAESRARIVLLRTGLVLDSEQGALPRMVLPFRFFVGGRLGSGDQFMPWIHIRDWVGLTAHLLATSAASGAVNLAAPKPVRNREFTAVLGRAVRRPSVLRTPRFVLRAVLGEMADELLLSSARMLPERAEALGYRFAYPDLEVALRDLLA